ncbi:hypothetical protein CN923_12735 [Bacillus cereus]|nr:hypothetical protein COM83_04605 [Bacillus cereus]PEQ40298.1 hypothetical protein CN467_10945 [Bacillus cereus]PEX91870.1 hypothetical protein CN465_23725 [Bacillus cereus]PFJ74243.1 hypothetical protein COI95_22865 [Bacillus cereus]PFJ83882.1 hypothetical protein COI97_29630 [Bacillus cereus]
MKNSLTYEIREMLAGPHAHQLKNSELPQNEKMSFLLQVSTIFCSGGYYKILACWRCDGTPSLSS